MNPPANNNAQPDPQPSPEPKPDESQPNVPEQQQPQPPVALTPEQEASVNELIAISGKSREMCIQALTAAHNIPDVAFEFLMSGHIP